MTLYRGYFQGRWLNCYLGIAFSLGACASMPAESSNGSQKVEYTIGGKPPDSCVKIAVVVAKPTRLTLSDASTFTEDDCISVLREKAANQKDNFLRIENLEREGDSYNYVCSGTAYSCLQTEGAF